MRSASGFTLIEIMIVVAVIGILAGMSAPIVSSAMDRYDIIAAGQQVASTVRAGRFQAIARNDTLRVRFDYPAAGQYQVVDTANVKVGEIQRLADGVTFGDGTADVQIDAEGRALAPSTITVTNGNADYDRTITVSTSGRVQLQ